VKETGGERGLKMEYKEIKKGTGGKGLGARHRGGRWEEEEDEVN